VAPLLVKVVLLPAVALSTVALLVNIIAPDSPLGLTAVTKFCVVPELLVMPVPLMVNTGLAVALTVIVKEFVAKELNVMAATCVGTVTRGDLNVLARLNVAVSPDPLGTVLGVQSNGLLQIEPVSFHAALPAKVVLAAESKNNVTVARKKMCVVLGKLRLVFIRLILHWSRRREKPVGRGDCEKCAHHVKS
jgi:hypothetical protein